MGPNIVDFSIHIHRIKNQDNSLITSIYHLSIKARLQKFPELTKVSLRDL